MYTGLMPELPEVETVRRGLNRLIVGKTICSVTYDTAKSFPNTAVDVDHFVIGAKPTAVRRRAKVLLIELSTGYTLVTHLKMTGQLVYIGRAQHEGVARASGGGADALDLLRSKTEGQAPPERFGAGHPNDSLVGALPDRSTRVIIEFDAERIDNGLESATRKRRSAEQMVGELPSVSTAAVDAVDDQEIWRNFWLRQKAGHISPCLFFNDQRKFGWMRLIPTIEVPHIDFMQRVGPEPLEDTFTAAEFTSRIRRRNNTTIKAAVLDQTVLAGVGNIYADESLWGAKLHPAMRVRDISDEQLALLLSEIKYVMNLSIEKGGSTDKNYVNAEGKRGSYIDFARVFRQEGKPCSRCGTTIEKIRVAGRGTHICPNCQVQ